MPVFPLLLTYVALDPVCNAPWLNYGFTQSPMRRQHEPAELRPTLFCAEPYFHAVSDQAPRCLVDPNQHRQTCKIANNIIDPPTYLEHLMPTRVSISNPSL